MNESDPADRLPRQLVVCCDGTNNTLTAGSQDTNVLQLVAHLASHPSPSRLLYYDPGVGSADAAPPTGPLDWAQRTWSRVAGLASGQGVYDNIALAYLFLMKHWRGEQDLIYIFGFSRGAFTARAVAGMVNLFGIVRPEHEALLPTLVHIYFAQPGKAKGALQSATRHLHAEMRRDKGLAPAAAGDAKDEREQLGLQVRALFATPAGRDAWVHWVGVWDTVESVGMPGPLARTISSSATVHDKRMRNVRHALAFDEHRWTFEPRLYDEPGDIEDPATGQTLKQRWFPGVHCDVGGSYLATDARLSSHALQWMVDEVADDLGIPALPASTEPRVRHDALWDTPWWALAGMCLRNMRPRPAGVAVSIIPGPDASAPTASVWAVRRKLWPCVAALVAGAICLVLSGAALFDNGWRAVADVGPVTVAHRATLFAQAQLASIWFGGFLTEGVRPWDVVGTPGWSMFWDLGFVVCWGYVLARIASRSFAWLAARRDERSGLPMWRWLGMVPLMAVGGDVVKDVMTWAALVAHWAGTDSIGVLFIFAAGLGSVAKWAGLAACLPLLLVRLWIAMPGVPRARPPMLG